MKIKPLNDRIVVKPSEAEKKTKNGIFLPESALEKPMRGKVIAAGPGRLNEDGKRTELEVKVGDEVIYGKYSGTEIEIKGDKHIILGEGELLAIVD